MSSESPARNQSPGQAQPVINIEPQKVTPTSRKIRQFRKVILLPEGTCPFREQKLAGCQHQGLRYENFVGKKLRKWAGSQEVREFLDNPWIDYDGRLAQPDRVIVLESGKVLLFEIKLTWVDTRDQLALYETLLNALGHFVVIKITVCKNLRLGVDRSKIVRNLDMIYDGCVLQMRS